MRSDMLLLIGTTTDVSDWPPVAGFTTVIITKLLVGYASTASG